MSGQPSGEPELVPAEEKRLLYWLEADKPRYLCELQLLLHQEFSGQEFSMSCLHYAIARLELANKKVSQPVSSAHTGGRCICLTPSCCSASQELQR